MNIFNDGSFFGNKEDILDKVILKELGISGRNVQTIGFEELEEYNYFKGKEIDILKSVITEEREKPIGKRSRAEVLKKFSLCTKKDKEENRKSKFSSRYITGKDAHQKEQLEIGFSVREHWLNKDEKYFMVYSVDLKYLPDVNVFLKKRDKIFQNPANFIVGMQIDEKRKVMRAIILLNKMKYSSALSVLESIREDLNSIDKDGQWMSDYSRMTITRIVPSTLKQEHLIDSIKNCINEDIELSL